MHYVVKVDGRYGYLYSEQDRASLAEKLEESGAKLVAKKPTEEMAKSAAENLQNAENVRTGTRTLGGQKKKVLGIASVTIDAQGNVLAVDFGS